MLREWAARARSIGKEIGKDIKAILASNLAQTRVEGSESTIKDLERTGGRTHTYICIASGHRRQSSPGRHTHRDVGWWHLPVGCKQRRVCPKAQSPASLTCAHHGDNGSVFGPSGPEEPVSVRSLRSQ